MSQCASNAKFGQAHVLLFIVLGLLTLRVSRQAAKLLARGIEAQDVRVAASHRRSSPLIGQKGPVDSGRSRTASSFEEEALF